jgi:predicted nucleotidyltransferase
MNGELKWPKEKIVAFCRKWRVIELSLFGSALREDFGPGSDVDLLYVFDSDAGWSLLDLAAMEAELEEILGRKVDLVSRRAIEQSHNWIRKKAILEGSRRIYGA